MNMTTPCYTTLAALAILLSACSDYNATNEPRTQTPSATNRPAETAPFAALEALPPECEMEGKDMSQMPAEEHQKMMDDCEAAQQRNPAPQ